MAEDSSMTALNGERAGPVVGVFRGPWDTGRPARDGAVIGFGDIFEAFSAAARAGELTLVSADIGIVRDYQRMRAFLAGCDVVYANCGPWAALLYVVREREQLAVRIIREVRTVGWVGYIWQEEVAAPLARTGDARVFPSRYARDIWEAVAPGLSEARVYYPILRRAARAAPVTRRGGTAGFFSVLSQDKGFAYLPGVIARMLAAGHAIDRLVLAGEQADPDLYASVVAVLTDMGVDVSFRGGLPNGDVRQLMAECDCVFFLSVSSIESLGRVIIEASEQGVPAITTDFGAAADLVRAAYRIPVRYLPEASGHCDRPFALAQLDLLRWEPPASLSAQACYLPAVRNYRAETQPATALLAHAVEPPARPCPIEFSYQCPVDAQALAHRLLDEHAALHAAPLHELLDLGGTLKQFLLASGYNPRVNFTPARDAQAHTVEPRAALNS